MKNNCEVVDSSEIYDILKKYINFEKKLKKEKYYRYIYYEISNLDKLVDGDLKVLKEEPLLLEHDKKNINVKYIKEYLLSYKDVSFTIKIEQNLFRIGAYWDEYSSVNSSLVFVPNKVLVNVTENGVNRNLVNKAYEIGRIHNIDLDVLNFFLKNDNAVYIDTISKKLISIEKLVIN